LTSLIVNDDNSHKWSDETCMRASLAAIQIVEEEMMWDECNRNIRDINLYHYLELATASRRQC